MTKTLPYAVLVFISVAWLWHSDFYSLSGPNPAEALGADSVSIGLPLVLLVFAARRLYRGFKQRGTLGPYKLLFGLICISFALLSFFDLFNPADAHKAGAVFWGIVFGITSTVLFGFAYGQKRRAIKRIDRNVKDTQPTASTGGNAA
jgi:hypothetical protein